LSALSNVACIAAIAPRSRELFEKNDMLIFIDGNLIQS
jgi:hypothetical protein